jgi:hypothetical protein
MKPIAIRPKPSSGSVEEDAGVVVLVVDVVEVVEVVEVVDDVPPNSSVCDSSC